MQLFDSWAGILAPDTFVEFAQSYAANIISALHARHPSTPVIYFANGCAPFLHVYRDSGADVLGIDWRVDLARARQALGDHPVQGNMDPGCLFLPDRELAHTVETILAKGASKPGYIFNLGHGVMPNTSMEKVRIMVETVKSFRVS